MYRLRLQYQDGLRVREQLPAINDAEAMRLLSLLFDSSLDLTEAELRAADGKLVGRKRRRVPD